MKGDICWGCAWYYPITEHCYLGRLETDEKILYRNQGIVEECLYYCPSILRMIKDVKEYPEELPYFLHSAKDILHKFQKFDDIEIIKSIEESLEKGISKDLTEKILNKLKKIGEELPYGCILES